MPVMPRYDKKANKIAFKLLGIPSPFKRKMTAKQKHIHEVLMAQDARRIK